MHDRDLYRLVDALRERGGSSSSEVWLALASFIEDITFRVEQLENRGRTSDDD